MSAAENKKLMRQIFAELEKGNGKPFVEAMADDFSWTITGNGAWSKKYAGKQAVLNELMKPLFSQFAGKYTNHAERFIAEDDFVVVECRGDVMTKTGKPYNNSYCYVCRLQDGKLRELTEYLDTALVAEALAPPSAA
ncbi:MAG TPA: nuclear transport factor 2 family protein [Xanthobacteraceae bacterium]|nr:nuclear transport factor 2 family protein [Xanthobacteraceae bacterium]